MEKSCLVVSGLAEASVTLMAGGESKYCKFRECSPRTCIPATEVTHLSFPAARVWEWRYLSLGEGTSFIPVILGPTLAFLGSVRQSVVSVEISGPTTRNCEAPQELRNPLDEKITISISKGLTDSKSHVFPFSCSVSSTEGSP